MVHFFICGCPGSSTLMEQLSFRHQNYLHTCQQPSGSMHQPGSRQETETKQLVEQKYNTRILSYNKIITKGIQKSPWYPKPEGQNGKEFRPPGEGAVWPPHCRGLAAVARPELRGDAGHLGRVDREQAGGTRWMGMRGLGAVGTQGRRAAGGGRDCRGHCSPCGCPGPQGLCQALRSSQGPQGAACLLPGTSTAQRRLPFKDNQRRQQRGNLGASGSKEEKGNERKLGKYNRFPFSVLLGHV